MLPPGALYGTEKPHSTARLLLGIRVRAAPCMHLESIKSASPAPSSAGAAGALELGGAKAPLSPPRPRVRAERGAPPRSASPGHTCVAPISAQSTSCSATNAVNKQQCLPKPGGR